MRSEGKILTVLVGTMLALFVLIAIVACNDTDSGGYQYPQDTSHGYYDVHHHYHYYPKYNKGSKYYVVPSKPKSKPHSGFGKSKSNGFRSGSKRR